MKKYRISEFARLTGVKKQTLLWYDKIGLFKPEHKNEKGYRYYTLHQFDLFSVIRTFRSMGISLETIQSFLDHRNLTTSKKIFEEQLTQVKKQIEILSNFKISLEKRLSTMQAVETIDCHSIQIEQQPREFLYRTNSFKNLSVEAQATEISNLSNLRFQTKQFGTALGGMVSKESFYANRTCYDYYYSVVHPNNCNFVKPEQAYLVAYFTGDYHLAYRLYPKIRAYASKHHFNLGDYSYEQSLVDETVSNAPENYITKISYPIIEQKQDEASEFNNYLSANNS